MNEDIRDCRLQSYLKTNISKFPQYNYAIRTLLNCGSYADETMGVHVISNNKSSRILGPRLCNHSWACPYCTAKTMAKYSAKVAAAIDALALQGLSAVMITFTVFHTVQYSCNEVFEILTEAYKLFNRNASWSGKKNNKIYSKAGAWQQFCSEFNVKHKIKVQEVTWGEHGWHPHMHNLYFVPTERLSEVAEWEEKLLNFWKKCETKVAEKIFSGKTLEVYKMLYERHDKLESHKGLYFSKNNDGNVRAIPSGDYVCGWGGNNEVTGGSRTLKTAHEKHFTPLQLLEKSFEENNDEYFEKYLEFASTVIRRKQHRIDFSRTGIKAIIQNYINSEGYKEALKKRNMSVSKKLDIQPYHLVCWFTKKQWQEICWIELEKGYPITFLIKNFALYEDGYNLICELMESINLKCPLPEAAQNVCEAFNKLVYAA